MPVPLGLSLDDCRFLYRALVSYRKTIECAYESGMNISLFASKGVLDREKEYCEKLIAKMDDAVESSLKRLSWWNEGKNGPDERTSD